MKEKIKLEVTVEIQYDNPQERAEAIQFAKENVLGTSMTCAMPLKAKLIKPIKTSDKL